MNIFRKKSEILYKKGCNLYGQEQYEEAFNIFEKLAKELDHIEAQTRLGYMYDNGQGTMVDSEQAMIWYNRAAIKGDVIAQYNLGIFYKHEMNYTKAIHWLEMAAAQDNDDAKNVLGDIYRLGEGVTINPRKAFEWYQKAADQGNSEAQYSLGLMYHKGKWAAMDYDEAFRWLQKAADQGNSEAQYQLGLMYQRGHGVGIDENKAFSCFQKVANQGNSEAQYQLGVMYKSGQGVGVNHEKAFSWFQKAAYQENSKAQFRLGLMYQQGQGVAINENESFNWLQKSADQNNGEAQYRLGEMYQSGQGVIADAKMAVKWLQKAADQGNNEAQYSLGAMYQTGESVPRDKKKSFQWFEKAALNDHAASNYRVAHAYVNGLGVRRDAEEALKWFAKTDEGPSDEDQLTLGISYMNGYGINENLTDAIYWLNRAEHMEQAKLCLGYLYENGIGEKDLKKAKLYLGSNFTGGIQSAMYDLGMTFLKMEGSTQALFWFEKAAEKNNMHALLAIGSIYLTGLGDGKEDVTKAYSYLSRAAKLEQVNLKVGQLKQTCDSEFDEGDYECEMKWYNKSKDEGQTIEKGCVSGLSCLGFLYHQGLGVRQNFKKAHEIYIEVLELTDGNDSDANMCIGLLYLKGLGMNQNFTKAMEYFEKSAKSINTYTYNIIGDAYKFGNGVEENSVTAMEWYMKGAKYGDGYSQLNVGIMYLDTLGLLAGGDVALNWFRKSYENGCKEAGDYIVLLGEEIRPANDRLIAAERAANEAAEEVRRLKAQLASVTIEKKNIPSTITGQTTSLAIGSSMESKRAKEPFQFFHLDNPSTLGASNTNDGTVFNANATVNGLHPRQESSLPENKFSFRKVKKRLQFFHLDYQQFQKPNAA